MVVAADLSTDEAREDSFMRQRKIATWLFVAVTILLLAGALLPLLKGESMNVTFLGASVVFLIIAAASARKAREQDETRPV